MILRVYQTHESQANSRNIVTGFDKEAHNLTDEAQLEFLPIQLFLSFVRLYFNSFGVKLVKPD